MLDHSEYGKRGYLDQDYRLFYLQDQRDLQIGFHYHEFDKLVLMLAGTVTYIVEGKAYYLRPWDVLLVSRNLIHRPVSDPQNSYQRMVIWVNRDYLERRSQESAPLAACFDLVAQRDYHLLRSEETFGIFQLAQNMRSEKGSRAFGHDLLTDTYFLQMMVAVNRALQTSNAADSSAFFCDPKVEEIRHYINDHLESELSIDLLAEKFYISRSYLMHRFKEISGYTVHQYVRQKRLLRASELLHAGMPAGQAASLAGFRDYSAFYRAYRSTFNAPPRGITGEELPEKPSGLAGAFWQNPGNPNKSKA